MVMPRTTARTRLALGIAWLAYALVYLGIFALVVAMPVGLLIVLARTLLP